MPPKARQHFRTFADWFQYTAQKADNDGISGADLYGLRRACYQEIAKIRGRPLIVYAVHLNPPPGSVTSINFDDVDGFVDMVRPISNQPAIDVLIHSPGGSPEATERIVTFLRSNFQTVGFLVPHSAYSAATMLALSGDEIVLHPAACLGPIDPQMNGIPVRAMRRGFDKAKETIKEEGPEILPVYLPLLEKYNLESLEIGEDYEQLSVALVTEWLTRFMFRGDEAKREIIATAVEFFANHDEHHTHARSFSCEKLAALGLAINQANGELADLLWEAHIMIEGFFALSGMIKLYENAFDVSWGRHPARRNESQSPQEVAANQ